MGPSASPALALALLALCGPPALAAEPDRWAGDAPELRERMEDFAEAEARGDLAGEELAQLNRYWATHLRRCDMNAIESAHYSAAELHLQRNNPKGAIAVLQKLLAAKPRDEIKNLTYLNLAEVYRRRLHDTTNAAKHYQLVAGPRRHRARHYMLRMLVEGGKTKEAASAIEDFIKKSTQKGEKLALLHRLAALYKRHEMPDQALAVYGRITAAYTAKDIEVMREAAIREVKNAILTIIELRENDQWEHAERVERQIHFRARELMLAKRWDELKAFQQAAEKGFMALERHERERDEEEEERERKDQRDDKERRKGEF